MSICGQLFQWARIINNPADIVGLVQNIHYSHLINAFNWLHLKYHFSTTRYSLFNNACYNLSSKSKLLWSYPVKPTLTFQGIINIYMYKQHFTTHVSYTISELLFNTLLYIYLTLFIILIQINCIHLPTLFFVSTHNMICISNTPRIVRM